MSEIVMTIPRELEPQVPDYQVAGTGQHIVRPLRKLRYGPRRMSPSERAFKLAACELVLEGIYPSGRQILKRLGKVDRLAHPNLNGRECAWKRQCLALFGLKSGWFD